MTIVGAEAENDPLPQGTAGVERLGVDDEAVLLPQISVHVVRMSCRVPSARSVTLI